MSKIPFIDRIWTTRGFIALDPPLSRSEVFARLDPLLEEAGTTHDTEGATLTYVKDNPAAQDKLATFSSGTLKVAQEDGARRMSYDLSSPALRLVFLAPLFFLVTAQGLSALSDYERTKAEIAKQAEEAEKDKDEKEDEEKDEPRNPIDEFLGAPQPLTLEEKKQRKEEAEKEDKHSSKPAYILAGIFAVLWLIGRLLEPWLVRRTFLRALYPDKYGDEPMHVTAYHAVVSRFRRPSSH